jgi:hypothetical protein
MHLLPCLHWLEYNIGCYLVDLGAEKERMVAIDEMYFPQLRWIYAVAVMWIKDLLISRQCILSSL